MSVVSQNISKFIKGRLNFDLIPQTDTSVIDTWHPVNKPGTHYTMEEPILKTWAQTVIAIYNMRKVYWMAGPIDLLHITVPGKKDKTRWIQATTWSPNRNLE